MTARPDPGDKYDGRDRQYSVPLEDGSRAMIDGAGGQDIQIVVNGQRICFSFSDRWGPLPMSRDGRRDLKLGHKHPFWRAVSLWAVQGQQVAEGVALWREPKKPVLRHLGGRHYMVIEDGEPGHDWLKGHSDVRF